jgi:hypothetical protein
MSDADHDFTTFISPSFLFGSVVLFGGMANGISIFIETGCARFFPSFKRLQINHLDLLAYTPIGIYIPGAFTYQ